MEEDLGLACVPQLAKVILLLKYVLDASNMADIQLQSTRPV